MQISQFSSHLALIVSNACSWKPASKTFIHCTCDCSIFLTKYGLCLDNICPILNVFLNRIT